MLSSNGDLLGLGYAFFTYRGVNNGSMALGVYTFLPDGRTRYKMRQLRLA